MWSRSFRPTTRSAVRLRYDELIKAIRSQHVGAIFTEPQYPDKVAATLSRETGIATAKLDPVATGPAIAPLDYYEKTMRANLQHAGEHPWNQLRRRLPRRIRAPERARHP